MIMGSSVSVATDKENDILWKSRTLRQFQNIKEKVMQEP